MGCNDSSGGGFAPTASLVHLLPCQPSQPPQHMGRMEGTQPIPHWMTQGPPPQKPGPANSWLYVPLLHAGQAGCNQGRRKHGPKTPAATITGKHSCSTCEKQPPCHGSNCAALVTTSNGGLLSTFEADLPRVLATAAGPLPPATHIHLPWAISRMRDSSGYIPATAQETLPHTHLARGTFGSNSSRPCRPLEATRAAAPPAQTTAPIHTSPAQPTSNHDNRRPPTTAAAKRASSGISRHSMLQGLTG